MKGFLKTILLLVLLLPAFILPAGAEEVQQDTNQILEEQLEISGADDLYNEVPEGTGDLLEENRIDGIDPESILNFSFGDFFNSLWSTIKQELMLPLRIFFTILAVILLCSLFRAFRTTIEERGYTTVFTVISILAVCGVIMAPAIDCITRAAARIEECSNFILSFIPVFTGVVAASGKPITAAGYTTAMFGAVQVIAQIAADFLVPLIGIFLAFCLAGSVNSQLNISGIVSTVRNVVVWTLGLLLTIFVGMLTIRGLVAGSADTVTTKTAKFLLGSFVPVVGGALSEALNSVQGCMGVIRTTVGSFGIIVCFLTFLPILINMLLLMGTFHLSAGIADMMDVEKVSGVLKAGASALSLLFGILLMFAMLLIISVTVLLMLGVG